MLAEGRQCKTQQIPHNGQRKSFYFRADLPLFLEEVRCAVTQSGCTFSEYVVLIKAPFLFKECVECALYTSVDNEILSLDGQINRTFPRKTEWTRCTWRNNTYFNNSLLYTSLPSLGYIQRENAAYYDSHRMYPSWNIITVADRTFKITYTHTHTHRGSCQTPGEVSSN